MKAILWIKGTCHPRAQEKMKTMNTSSKKLKREEMKLEQVFETMKVTSELEDYD